MIAHRGFGEDLMAGAREGKTFLGKVRGVEGGIVRVHGELVDAVAQFGRKAQEAG